ncbi:hypothetical protein ACIF9R_13740 [Streptomyces sp. NPDC086080]|uniref:hypothetical protein n=1 Tax=Streptomyces sp. NPDC086080 TaxID=3365748 RepID=UPI0037D278F2
MKIDEATSTLNEQKDQVPEELAPAVETLISVVARVDDPRTLAQDRQGVVESAEHLSTALAAISDPSTPPELRKELTAIVKQVTSALEVVSDPGVAPEERSMLILVIKRTTSTLDMICEPKTPPEVRDPMIATVMDANHLAESSQRHLVADSTHASQIPPASSDTPQNTPEALQGVGASMEVARDPRTPPKDREELARVTQQVSALMKKINDPGTSQQERSEAGKELEEKTSRMKNEQEEAAAAQERPRESLGKAAAFCTSAVFESTRESDLMEGLKKLVPAQWEEEGVKDFWKAEEKSDDMLDVLAQLRSNEHAHGPFEVVPLITALAELVPRDKLFGTLGGSALYCEQTAKYLDEESGVTVGTWLTKTGE